METKILTFCNVKGGVGKSISAMSFASILPVCSLIPFLLSSPSWLLPSRQ